MGAVEHDRGMSGHQTLPGIEDNGFHNQHELRITFPLRSMRRQSQEMQISLRKLNLATYFSGLPLIRSAMA